VPLRPPPPSDEHDDAPSLRDIARAIELQQNGRLDDAEALYAKLLVRDASDPTVLVNAGLLSLARNDIEAAIDRLQRAIGIVPANPIAHASLGRALRAAGRNDEAMRELRRALALRPDDTETARQLAELQERSRQAPDAAGYQ
jgi:tetratricopeptide (TPR) repeat protein